MTDDERIKHIENLYSELCLIDLKYSGIIKALESKLQIAKEALEFYAKNEGLYIDHQTNVFRSSDSDERDFHGARARQALAEIDSLPHKPINENDNGGN